MDIEKIQEAAKMILEAIGEDTSREGLPEMPQRRARKDRYSESRTQLGYLLVPTHRQAWDPLIRLHAGGSQEVRNWKPQSI